ncbi:hypothetical protein EER27_04705 [Lysobacter psychrotolerans]|uniref:Uncharacterized protein n=2 Tax=Montanilutibacter psychrotolerans TaxID=1327343 RepID=A0A3M8SUR9_9GAMM|nr:hypothetical protein EER27_04705 [Lysobacter psychrotolerans]
MGLLAPCLAQEASQPIERLPVTDARNSAAQYAFTQGLIHTKISEKCQKHPDPIRANAIAALASWRERNQYLVTPAFFWTKYVSVTNSQGQGYVLRTLQSYDADAEQAVRTTLPGRKPDAAACTEALSGFSDGALDLRNSEHAPSLQEIREYSYKFSVPATTR